MISPGEAVQLGRDFMKHPLASRQDTRNIVILEMFAIRGPFQVPLGKRVDVTELDRMIPDVIRRIEGWESHWLNYYGS